MSSPPDAYPVQFAVEYPDRQLDRVTSFFRIFAAVPILIVLGLISSDGFSARSSGAGDWSLAWGAGGLLFLPVLLMLVFRQKYPRWWFDWNREVMRFTARVGIYLALMDDRYPSTDEAQSVRLDFEYPDAATDLNRWLPIVKWFLAIPHFIVLFFLWVGALVAVIMVWFSILFTGRYPRGLFDYVEGVARWEYRVIGYAFTLVTDEYPPFRLSA